MRSLRFQGKSAWRLNERRRTNHKLTPKAPLSVTEASEVCHWIVSPPETRCGLQDGDRGGADEPRKAKTIETME